MNAVAVLRAPFPYFGGKSKIAPEIWRAFGSVANYVEPFFGSGACLLARPDFDPEARRIETVNDADGYVANFWRALSIDPEAVAHYADWPVNEIDLHARHGWLINRRDRLLWSLEDPEFYDAKIAGWWVWGISAWIGSGWCSGKGPHVHTGAHLHDSRKLPRLGDAGRGVNRQLPHLGDAGRGRLQDYFAALAARLRRVRVCCGDWTRVMGPSVTTKHGVTGVFLDPPYSGDVRDPNLYATESATVAADVHAWAMEHGDDPLLRIAVCGYEGEAEYPDSWRCIAWIAGAGFGGQARERSGNGKKERIWLSPHCLGAPQSDLFS